MKTIYQLQQIAARLRAVTEVNSISPEDTFGLQSDILEYLADMEQNAEGLGIHKVYASYAAMVADASAPVGSNGKVLRFGQLVVIYDSNNTTQAESGNVYAWQKGYTGAAAWLLMGNLGSVSALQSLIDGLLSSLAYEENARTSADNEIKEELASNKTEVDGKIEEITAKMESSYIDITDNYEFSNGKISSLRNISSGATFNGDYSASDNNYKHLILDTQEGEEFYVSGNSNDYYNIATFIDTTTNTVKGIYFRNVGSTFLQKIVTPEGANQVVFIFHIANNTPFGIYKKMGGDNLEGGMWYDLNYP